MVPSRYLRTYSATRDLGEPLLDLHREMNRLFDDVVRNSFSFWPLNLNAAQQAAQQAVQQASMALTASPRVDLQENDEDLVVTVDLPGVQQSDVEVKVEGDTLIICGEKRSSSEQQRPQNYHLMERSYGRFERSVSLPFSPDPERAEASYENGVLSVRLPKEEEQRSHRIEVQASSEVSSRGQSRRGEQGSQQYLSDRDRERAGANVQFSAEASQGEGQGQGSSSSRGGSSSSGGSQSPQKSSSERKQPQPA